MKIDYSKSKIYKITNDYNDDVYVGSTSLVLSMRWNLHIASFTDPERQTTACLLFSKFGIDNCKIKELEKKICTREERFEIEGKYIVEYKNNSEYNCVNIVINTGKCVGLPKNVSIQGEHNMLIKSNKTGVAGVMFHKCSGLWRARISFKGKRMELGDYPTFEEAVQARLKKENQLLGTNHITINQAPQN